MKRKWVSIVAIVILVIFGLTFALAYLPVFAATPQQQLQAAQQKKKEQLQKLQDLQKQAEENKNKNAVIKENAIQQKTESDQKLAQIQNEQDQIQDQLNSINQNINTLNDQYQEAEENAQNQTESMKKRLRAMQEGSISGYLDVIFSSKSLSDFFVRLDMIKDIMEYDNGILQQLKTISNDLKDRKTEIEAEKTNKEAEEISLNANKEQVENIIEEQKKLVNTVEQQENKDAQNIKDANKAVSQTDNDIKRLEDQVLNQVQQQQTKQEYTGGQFIWPVPSCHTVTSLYGNRTDPVSGKYTLHNGVDIGAPYGSAVVAAAAGRVLFAGYDSGYGNYITIDHGGMVTLYAHNSRLLVSTGQQIQQGQQISVSGSTGWSTGPHVHFTMIKNGSYVNPLSYVH